MVVTSRTNSSSSTTSTRLAAPIDASRKVSSLLWGWECATGVPVGDGGLTGGSCRNHKRRPRVSAPGFDGFRPRRSHPFHRARSPSRDPARAHDPGRPAGAVAGGRAPGRPGADRRAPLAPAGTAWPVPLLFVHGYVLAFLFCAFHETAHRTAFRTRWLNTVLGTLAGLLIVWPYRNYRVYHWGAPPLHSGRGARSRALLPQARLTRGIPPDAHRRAEPGPPPDRSAPSRLRACRPAVDERGRRPPPSSSRRA